MDIKITKKRFGNLISYDLIKIIIAIVAAIAVWVLLFTTCATRATVGEQFYFVIFDGVSFKENYPYEMIGKLKNENKLSYDVLETSVSAVTAAGNYSALYMLSLKSTTKEGDVIIFNGKREEVKNEDGTVKKDENGVTETKVNETAQSVVNNSYLTSFDEYLASAKKYLDRFLTNGEVDEKAVEDYFLSVRVKQAGNYKKTYRTAEQKAQGVKNEIERIKTLRSNYLTVVEAIAKADADGVDLYWYCDFAPSEEYKKERVPYGIDLYKLNQKAMETENSGKEKLSDIWYFWEYTENEKGDKEPVRRSDGLVLSVFNFEKDQPDLNYESLAVIADAIKTFSYYAD